MWAHVKVGKQYDRGVRTWYLDMDVLHLAARELHAQQEEGRLAQGRLHPVPRPDAHLEPGLWHSGVVEEFCSGVL